MCQLVRNHTISGVNEIYFRKSYSLCKSCTLDLQTLHISKILMSEQVEPRKRTSTGK